MTPLVSEKVAPLTWWASEIDSGALRIDLRSLSGLTGLQCKESSIKGCCKSNLEYEAVSKIKETAIGEHIKVHFHFEFVF